MLNRRRFLIVSAFALAAPGRRAEPAVEWHGKGFGTSVSLKLSGLDRARMALLVPKIEAEIARIEAVASLHTESELVRLNATGKLNWPSDGMVELLTLSDRIHQATGGAFDPTVQPLWLATATGGDAESARKVVGWDRLHFDRSRVQLGPGQALTFNGIAQGWAADRIAALLAAEGLGTAMIDMGEVMALGQNPAGTPWHAEIRGPDDEPLAGAALADRALAVSSPMGTRIGGGRPHIVGPAGQAPRWETVAVTAPRAAWADALSTAFCLMDRKDCDAALEAFPGARIIWAG